jgi:hypothetical protein
MTTTLLVLTVLFARDLLWLMTIGHAAALPSSRADRGSLSRSAWPGNRLSFDLSCDGLS